MKPSAKSLFRKTLLLLLTLSSMHCASVRKNRSSNVKNTPVPELDFCQLKGVESNPSLPALWSAETVSFQIDALIKDPSVYGTPWMAYPVAYRKMTAARDIARCEGELKSDDFVNARLNHMLSDVMSRWYVMSVRECAKANAALGSNAGFCPLMKKMRVERYDSLSAAMASTAVYLSSHIALALSAIIIADDFWEQMPDSATHKSGNAPWSQVRDARIAALKGFKPTFDRFNGFLANNLSTVAHALKEADLLNGDALNFLTGFVRLIPFRAAAFGSIRDGAFNNAIVLAETLNPSDHPMIRIDGDRSRLNYEGFQFGFVYPAKLKALESFALFAVANQGNMEIYRRLLGGKSWDEVERDLKIKVLDPEDIIPL